MRVLAQNAVILEEMEKKIDAGILVSRRYFSLHYVLLLYKWCSHGPKHRFFPTNYFSLAQRGI